MPTRFAHAHARIAHEIVERNPDLDRTALVGIHTRGVPLAHRLRRLIADFTNVEFPSAASTSPSIATTSGCEAASFPSVRSPSSRRRGSSSRSKG